MGTEARAEGKFFLQMEKGLIYQFKIVEKDMDMVFLYSVFRNGIILLDEKNLIYKSKRKY
jgi:hypothetical protein